LSYREHRGKRIENAYRKIIIKVESRIKEANAGVDAAVSISIDVDR